MSVAIGEAHAAYFQESVQIRNVDVALVLLNQVFVIVSYTLANFCNSISLAALSGPQVGAAQNHAQRRHINLNRQAARRLQWTLKATAFQTLCPHHQTIAVPHQNLATIQRAIEEHEVIAAQHIHRKLVGHNRM